MEGWLQLEECEGWRHTCLNLIYLCFIFFLTGIKWHFMRVNSEILKSVYIMLLPQVDYATKRRGPSYTALHNTHTYAQRHSHGHLFRTQRNQQLKREYEKCVRLQLKRKELGSFPIPLFITKDLVLRRVTQVIRPEEKDRVEIFIDYRAKCVCVSKD